MRKFFTRKNMIRFGFVALFLFTIYLVSSVLSIKSGHGIDQQGGLYWQPEDTIDVAMMGSSHIHCNVNTALLWEEYGIAAYDYSGAEQPLWMTYFYLRELYKYQKPKMIVLDLYSPARFKEDYQYKWIAENTYGMRFSLNKLEMLACSVEFSKLSRYYPSFAVYHSRYDDLEKEDFENFFWDIEDKAAFKGYTPYFSISPQVKQQISEEESGGLTPKSEKYLRKIISYTKEQGSELVLMVAPYPVTVDEQRTYNSIAQIAEQEDIPFIDYNDYYDEMGLDFERDFNDGSHLNYWGSCKFSRLLGEFIAASGKVPDRRMQEGYESWDYHVELIAEELLTYGGNNNR